MRILALDSSGLVAAVAIVDEEQTIAEYTLNYKKTHSQTLLPMLDEMIEMAGLDPAEIDAIAVSGGPGSFTGLRIGSATAKGLGLAWKKPLIHVPTLEGLAYNLYHVSGIICPMMDARRQQVYTGLYSWEDEFCVIEGQMAVSVEELIQKLNALGKKVTFLGDGVPVYREFLERNLLVAHDYAPGHLNRQRASAIGMRGIEYYKADRTESAAEHRPEYLRMSQAERERAKREEKEKNNVG